MRTLTLGDRGSDDPAEVGNKAASLSRLTARYRIPPAFCLTTSAYDSLKGALDASGETERVELNRLVVDAYASLTARIGVDQPRVAVRSSAIGEDSADASFAGQYETTLNISGVNAIVDAVLACWRSLGNERVRAYRRERGIDGPARMGVMVQQMVDADVSAIAFGADPVSGDASLVVIDAARGLGDRIASGEVTPDRYTVRKSDLSIVEQPDRGPLSAKDAAAIARLVIELERDDARPVDVECAIARGDLYLLQCRPITTLSTEFTVTWGDPKDAELNWTRDDAHAGLPQAQLMVDLFRKIGPHAIRQTVEAFEPPMLARLETFNGRGYMALQPRVPPDEMPERTRAYQARIRAHARGLRRSWDEEYLPRLLGHYAWMRGLDFANAPLDDVADAWEELTRRMGDAWAMHMMVTSGAYPIMGELVETYARLTGADGVEALRLTQGMAPTLYRIERDLYGIIQRARSAPAVAEALTAGTITDLADLRALDGGPDVAAAILELIEAHGDLGNAGEDLAGPSWADDHALLFAELGRRIAAPLEDPETRRSRLLAEGQSVEARVRAKLRDRPADLATFEEVLATARAAGPLTEEHNYWLDCKATSQFSRLVRALGARLSSESLLDRPDDIRHLHIDEISAMLRERRDGRLLARERAAEYARWQRMRAPKTLGSLGAPTAARTELQYRTPQREDLTLKGIAASSGVRRGAAKLVRGTEDFKKLRPGDVLVCRSSNVNWIPLFTIAAAVVTDVGGALSHAAVVAREFGVPAVTGVGVAFERLGDGMLVEVDGDRGTVRPL